MNIYLLSFIVFIFGLSLGSFANVCIYRLPQIKYTLLGRSFCQRCKKKIKWCDNIPLISYLMLGGKCRNCKKAFSINYFIVELIYGIGFLLIFLFYENYLEIIFLQFILLIFVIILFIDFKHFIIPDSLNFMFCLLAFLKNFTNNFDSNFTYNYVISTLGGALGFLIIYVIIYFYKKFKNIEAMGLGDAKFMIGAGFLFGPESVLLILFYGSVLGLIYVIPPLINKSKNLKTKLPFGPFLIFGTIIYYFSGNFLF